MLQMDIEDLEKVRSGSDKNAFDVKKKDAFRVEDMYANFVVTFYRSILFYEIANSLHRRSTTLVWSDTDAHKT